MSPPPREFNLSRPRDISDLLTYAANALVKGRIDFKVCHAFGHLADCAVRAYHAGALAEAVERLERLAQIGQNQNLPCDSLNDPRLRFIFEEKPQTEPQQESQDQASGRPR